MTEPLKPQDYEALLESLLTPSALAEAVVVLGCIGLAWLAVRGLRGRQVIRGSVWFGDRIVDGVLFPGLVLALAYAARALVAKAVPLAVFKLAIPILVSFAVIRLSAKVLYAAYPRSSWVRLTERTISWIAWGAVVLWVTGLLPLLLEELDQIKWSLGGSKISLRTVIEGTLTAALVLMIALWVSAAIEARLLRGAGDQLSLRKMAANAVRAILLFVGLLLALSAVGIDLTALSVLGGAIGVGIGFGLQKLAANYVSGFVILAERSLRIGDNVRIDNFEGRITDIKTRYTVIRSLTGRESIVPNEQLITTRVENLSLADPKVWQSTVVQAGYASDPDQVIRLLEQVVRDHRRVLRDPEPRGYLSAFAADGLEFTLGYWIADPENGQLNLKSDINLAILKALRSNGIQIPYPQRVLHIGGGGHIAGDGPPGAPKT